MPKKQEVVYTLVELSFDLSLMQPHQGTPFCPRVTTYNKLKTAEKAASQQIEHLYKAYKNSDIRENSQDATEDTVWKYNHVLFIKDEQNDLQCLFQIWETPVLKKHDLE